jgi:hypothetical protein
MAIFNSYVKLPEGKSQENWDRQKSAPSLAMEGLESLEVSP